MSAWQPSRFRAGDLVEVRSAQEIFGTLDAAGRLDGMPFMPEMLAFCGRRLRIAAVAHKTCDPAHKTGGRRLDRAVHLVDARCNGSAHGGCEAECNLFWKDEWLKNAAEDAALSPPSTTAVAHQLPTTTSSGAYTCQATELIHASQKLPWWNCRQYFLDLLTGNHAGRTVAKVLILSWSRQLLRIPVGFRIWAGLNDWIHRRLTGQVAPRVSGTVAQGQKTPDGRLDLQPGERVIVRSLRDIAVTLDRNSKNRGMWFDVEQIGYCGHSFQVRRRVSRIINEQTGEMMESKNPCITLEGIYCSGHHSQDRLLCPRAITPYWREVWLERAGPEK